MGLSPRTRGNRSVALILANPMGPIPAHAGQPSPPALQGNRPGAYPRARGATRRWRSSRNCGSGLSPRTRGNPTKLLTARSGLRPIPAHAGQPATSCATCPPTWAYPRARGATGSRRPLELWGRGLSPRTRGNPSVGPSKGHHGGPIPAHAGQPSSSDAKSALLGAYPRARGAPPQLADISAASRGLSPRTRGNRCWTADLRTRLGPIPAHAGQPCRAG